MKGNYQDLKSEKDTRYHDGLDRMLEAIEQFKEWNKIEAEKLETLGFKRGFKND